MLRTATGMPEMEYHNGTSGVNPIFEIETDLDSKELSTFEKVDQTFEEKMSAFSKLRSEFNLMISNGYDKDKISDIKTRASQALQEIQESELDYKQTRTEFEERSTTSCFGKKMTRYQRCKTCASSLGWIATGSSFALAIIEPLTLAGSVLGICSSVILGLNDPNVSFCCSDPRAVLDEQSSKWNKRQLEINQFAQFISFLGTVQLLENDLQRLHDKNIEEKKPPIREKAPIKKRAKDLKIDYKTFSQDPSQSSSSSSSPPTIEDPLENLAEKIAEEQCKKCLQSYSDIPHIPLAEKQSTLDNLISAYITRLPEEHPLKQIRDSAFSEAIEKIPTEEEHSIPSLSSLSSSSRVGSRQMLVRSRTGIRDLTKTDSAELPLPSLESKSWDVVSGASKKTESTPLIQKESKRSVSNLFSAVRERFGIAVSSFRTEGLKLFPNKQVEIIERSETSEKLFE